MRIILKMTLKDVRYELDRTGLGLSQLVGFLWNDNDISGFIKTVHFE